MPENLLKTFNTIFSADISASVPALLLLLVPGFICVQIQNRYRGHDRVELTGTSYVLFVLIVSCVLITFFWLMHQLCLRYNTPFQSMLPTALTLYIAFWHYDPYKVVKTPDTSSDLYKYILDNWILVLIDFGLLILFVLSFMYSWKFALLCTLLYIISHHCLHNFIFKYLVPQVEDVFYHTFKDLYENKKPVLMTLKNGQVYVGRVLEYPKNLSKPIAEQSVSIMPFLSGYRSDTDKTIKWINNYRPLYTDIKDGELKISISRAKVVSFGEFNRTVHEYFKKFKESNNSPKT